VTVIGDAPIDTPRRDLEKGQRPFRGAAYTNGSQYNKVQEMVDDYIQDVRYFRAS
jgi:hypothetical protein